MSRLDEVRDNYKNIENNDEIHILVCADTGCKASGSDNLIDKLRSVILEKKLDSVRVIQVGCLGLCSKGPFVIIKNDNTYYGSIALDDCSEIISSHIIEKKIVDRLLVKDVDGLVKNKISEINFYKKQDRRVLKLSGVIDPDSIEDYIIHDGYKALEKTLNTEQEKIIDEITSSNLRGRGGAGFKTGVKWKSAFDNNSDEKYIVCNADEGDPGAFMDRSILEGNPHSVIEGLIIGAYAIGASKGYIYIRAEYPSAVKRLKRSINKAREFNLLGESILGSGFDFDLEIRIGAGAFVCGEETALLESIEGKKGNPRSKPPFPTEKGLWGKPTVINNVETLASISGIILNGSNWFKSIGTDSSGGTKVFALGGNIVNIGLVEVPIGITLREVIYDIGGGIPNNKKFKAAQTGGPSGGCIPESLLDVKIDYENLSEIGSMMGSGGLIIVDDSKCMVSLAKYYLEFSVSESCGKCTPCRIGTKRMYELLEKICTGKGTLEDLDLLEKLAINITKTSLCGLGKAAPNPVLSTLKYFKDEYIEHVKDRKCRCNQCNMNSEVLIDEALCKACGVCQKTCPVSAIEGEDKSIRKINQDKCIKCRACVNSCPFKAIKG